VDGVKTLVTNVNIRVRFWEFYNINEGDNFIPKYVNSKWALFYSIYDKYHIVDGNVDKTYPIDTQD
jgi:hypothetical protein